MIIGACSRFKSEDLLSYVNYGLWAAALLVLAVGAFFFFSQEDNFTPQASRASSAKKQYLEETYSIIGQGPLSLHSEGQVGNIPNLSHEVQILARNTRPDVQGREAQLLLLLKGSKEEKIALNGQKVYLDWESSQGAAPRLHFANEPTELWMTPFIADRTSTILEIGMKLPLTETEETAQFNLEDSGGFKESAIQENVSFRILSEAKWWGFDSLFQKYGGEEYKHLRDKHKLEFVQPSSYACFVSPGDFLMWEDGKWQVVALHEAKPDLPIAQVKAIGGHGLELEAWDETGFHPAQIRLAPQHINRLSYKQENLPSLLRLRTSSQITCLLGKRRVILKQGDWLLKTSSGWHILKRTEEIEDCLQHRIRGELFIFDQLEKDDGKFCLKGSLFDEMRTQIHPVSIPIAGDKNSSRTSRKKKHVLSKKDLLSSPSAKNGAD